MDPRRQYSSSRPTPGGAGQAVPGRRRRRSRSGQRLKRRLLALGFGLALFGLAGGLLALLAGELGGSLEEEPTAAVERATVTGSRAPADAVAIVTCPGTDKSTQHPAYAAACGDRAALKGQLARPGAGEAFDPRPEFAGRTALHHAAQRGDTVMLGDLLVAGANPNQPDAEGQTPLHLVAATPQLRHPEFVARRLLQGGARIDLRNLRGLTPIEELETHHQRLLERQNLAKLLFQKEREDHLVQSLATPHDEPGTERRGESVVEVDTAMGRVRIPVDPPAADAPD